MLDSAPSDAASAAFSKLLAIMAKLRDPNGGCPWDLEQSFRTIVPHTIEEAYEVADAIEQDDMESLKGELGDLLFQAVFYAQMAREAGTFTMADVLEALNAKMIKRHPHVFGDLAIADAAEQTHAWERQKAEERAAAAAAKGQKPSALDGVTGGLPALTRAVKLQNRAARVGFDWPEPAQVLDKIAEETGEIRAALEEKAPKDSIAEEIGDLLFAVSTWRGTWRSTARPPCAPPTASSSAASAGSRKCWQRKAKSRPAARWTRWKPPGPRPKAKNGDESDGAARRRRDADRRGQWRAPGTRMRISGSATSVPAGIAIAKSSTTRCSSLSCRSWQERPSSISAVAKGATRGNSRGAARGSPASTSRAR